MCQEWKERAPIFYAFLMTVALSNGTKDASWLPSVSVAGSILLKQRSRHMNATAAFLAILKTASTEVSLLNASDIFLDNLQLNTLQIKYVSK